MRQCAPLLFVAMLVGRDLPASAQMFSVSAEIVPGCSVQGSQGSGLALGVLDFGSHPATRLGQVQAVAMSGGGVLALRCTPDLALNLQVDGGLHLLGGVRRLSDGASFVPYALYADADDTTPIPVSAPVDLMVPPSGTLILPLHGLASLPGSLTPGVYADTLQVSVTW